MNTQQQQATNGHAPSGGRGLRQKLTNSDFPANVPRVIGLEFDPPTEAREGRFGDQYMYFLSNNEIIFADPPFHAAILESGARKGDEVAMCKREVRTGNRKRIQWEAELQSTGFEQQPAPAQAPAAAAPPARPLASQPREPKPTGTTPKTNRGVLMTGNLMAAALKQAMEACSEAEYEPGPGDVRTLAITIYISATGGGKSK